MIFFAPAGENPTSSGEVERSPKRVRKAKICYTPSTYEGGSKKLTKPHASPKVKKLPPKTKAAGLPKPNIPYNMEIKRTVPIPNSSAETNNETNNEELPPDPPLPPPIPRQLFLEPITPGNFMNELKNIEEPLVEKVQQPQEVGAVRKAIIILTS